MKESHKDNSPGLNKHICNYCARYKQLRKLPLHHQSTCFAFADTVTVSSQTLYRVTIINLRVLVFKNQRLQLTIIFTKHQIIILLIYHFFYKMSVNSENIQSNFPIKGYIFRCLSLSGLQPQTPQIILKLNPAFSFCCCCCCFWHICSKSYQNVNGLSKYKFWKYFLEIEYCI